jgi:GNAT superfamily N-acetyltransferase
MPYEYFDRYVFESWVCYGQPESLNLYKLKPLGDGRARWSAHDEDGHHVYAFEVRDADLVERHAWAFVVERDGALEVEELYVRPEYRGLGHGGWLADRVAQLAREKGMPLRLWVGFADCKSESESNYPALVATARRLGVQFRPSPVPWAAYFGTTEHPGESIPVEPESIPARPRTPRNQFLAMVLALGMGNGDTGTKTNPAPTPSQPSAVIAADDRQPECPQIGTVAWDKLNARRAELIRKKNRWGLDSGEMREYEELQRISQAALERAFPAPSNGDEELARIVATLGLSPEETLE